MFKKIVITSVSILLPTVVFAQNDNVGRCGWGSKLMAGQSGIAPQVLAVTTNGTSGNQTFGITSGTSGCTQDGVVQSNWKTAMFIDSNMNKLAKDMSVGSGESLESLANLLAMDKSDKELFFQVSKTNFNNIFASSNASSKEVMASLKTVLNSNEALAKYSSLM